MADVKKAGFQLAFFAKCAMLERPDMPVLMKEDLDVSQIARALRIGGASACRALES
jgi:mevalonate pyrophosphate decarboxylase